MIKPDKPLNESERLRALRSYAVLDSITEKEYDQLTSIASEICGSSMSLISLVDEERQWFKSRVGLDVSETHRDFAFCGHAILHPGQALIVEDARIDPRFQDNPLVKGNPHLVFYAGIPLVNDDGYALGTLCVLDQKPKHLSEGQIRALNALRDQVMALLELRRSKLAIEKSMQLLGEKNRDLEQFAFIAAHDMKSPLNGIASLTELIIDSHGSALGEDGVRMINAIKSSTHQLSGMIAGLLDYYRLDSAHVDQRQTISIIDLQAQIAELYAGENRLVIEVATSMDDLHVHRSAVLHILVNLISNALKYGDKEINLVKILVEESPSDYLFEVADNGPGIPEEFHQKLFQLFSVLTPHDRHGQKGNGIGLATVKKLVERLGGSVTLVSIPPAGATFRFSIAK